MNSAARGWRWKRLRARPMPTKETRSTGIWTARAARVAVIMRNHLPGSARPRALFQDLDAELPGQVLELPGRDDRPAEVLPAQVQAGEVRPPQVGLPEFHLAEVDAREVAAHER